MFQENIENILIEKNLINTLQESERLKNILREEWIPFIKLINKLEKEKFSKGNKILYENKHFIIKYSFYSPLVIYKKTKKFFKIKEEKIFEATIDYLKNTCFVIDFIDITYKEDFINLFNELDAEYKNHITKKCDEQTIKNELLKLTNFKF